MRKLHALLGVIPNYRSRCQPGGTHERNSLRHAHRISRRAETDHSAARIVLLACPRPIVAYRPPHGGWNAAGPWDHEGDAHGGEGLPPPSMPSPRAAWRAAASSLRSTPPTWSFF